MTKQKLLLRLAVEVGAVQKTIAELAEDAGAPKEQTDDSGSISLEQVRGVLADKSRAGHTADIRALLIKHGADKLSEIEQSEYAAIMAEAEVLGNE